MFVGVKWTSFGRRGEKGIRGEAKKAVSSVAIQTSLQCGPLDGCSLITLCKQGKKNEETSNMTGHTV